MADGLRDGGVQGAQMSGYTSPERRMTNLRLHLYSILVAVATLCLIVSGAAVASQEGASEGWHRAIGAFVAVLVVGLGVWLVVTKTHEWLRRLGRAAVAVTIADAGLGLLAGPAAAPASPMASMAHAFLAPVLLSLVAAIALATSRSWQCDPILLQDQGWPPLRGVARNTLALVVIQVGLGAAFRYGSIGVMVHILGAMIVVVFILTLVVLVTLMPEHPTMRPAAITLGDEAGNSTLTVAQSATDPLSSASATSVQPWPDMALKIASWVSIRLSVAQVPNSAQPQLTDITRAKPSVTMWL